MIGFIEKESQMCGISSGGTGSIQSGLSEFRSLEQVVCVGQLVARRMDRWRGTR